MNTSVVRRLILVVCGASFACSSEEEPVADLGVSADLGPRDVGAGQDSGVVDLGFLGGDAGFDGGPIDSGLDGGVSDSGPRVDGGTPVPGERPVTRGGNYFGFPERFNRAYTDPSWTPTRTLWVSPNGNGDGSSANTPAAASDTPNLVEPGTKVIFLAGTYSNFCIELDDSTSGTYDQPIVLAAERAGAAWDVHLECCGSGRQTCVNLENASYVAVMDFEMSGGNYGVRSVGGGFEASNHARGILALRNHIHGQERDPILTGASDWDVFEANVCHDGGPGDGHGIYLSNGSDFNIVRGNELYENVSSDFQINADPTFSCTDVGIPFDDPRCDDYAGTGEGGQGVSDYMLIENNFFHHGNAQGPNFTSVRRSVVRNNIFGIYDRHGVSFWQETDNPRLGSSDNLVHHNLFISNNQRQMLMFIVDSTRNDVRNNLFVGAQIGNTVTANPNAVWIETDGTVSDNVYAGNYYISGRFDGDAPRAANASETTRADLDPSWWANFPTQLAHDPQAFRPTAAAPFVGSAARLPELGADRDGRPRSDPTTPGPFEAP